MLQAPRVVMRFSYPFFSSAAPLNSIVADGMEINFQTLKNYWIQRGKKIYACAQRLPKGKLHFLIVHGRFYLIDHTKGEPVAFKTDLTLDHGRLSAHGFWNDKNRFNYKLYGNVRNSGFDLDKLTWENGRSSTDLWGSWHDNDILWKGFIFYEKFYILDINGDLKIQEKDIVLKHLSFSIDGDDVKAWGHCSRQNLFQCDADITYQRQIQHRNLQEPLKNINLHLHAHNSPQGLFFKGRADFYFLFNPDSPTSLQSMHLDFENLKAQIVNGNFVRFKIKQLQSIFLIQGNGHNVPMENIFGQLQFCRALPKNHRFFCPNIYGAPQQQDFPGHLFSPVANQKSGKFRRDRH